MTLSTLNFFSPIIAASSTPSKAWERCACRLNITNVPFPDGAVTPYRIKRNCSFVYDYIVRSYPLKGIGLSQTLNRHPSIAQWTAEAAELWRTDKVAFIGDESDHLKVKKHMYRCTLSKYWWTCRNEMTGFYRRANNKNTNSWIRCSGRTERKTLQVRPGWLFYVYRLLAVTDERVWPSK